MADETATVAETTTLTQETQTSQPAGTSGNQGAVIQMTREESDRRDADIRRATEKQVRESDEIKQLRAAAKRLAEIEESSKSDLDKLTDRAAKAEAERDAAVTSLRTARLHMAFSNAAAGKGLSGQPLTDALALADLSSVPFTEDGTPDGKAVGVALDAVLKDRPYLTATKSGVPDINGGGTTAVATKQQVAEQARRDANASGRYRGLL